MLTAMRSVCSRALDNRSRANAHALLTGLELKSERLNTPRPSSRLNKCSRSRRVKPSLNSFNASVRHVKAGVSSSRLKACIELGQGVQRHGYGDKACKAVHTLPSFIFTNLSLRALVTYAMVSFRAGTLQAGIDRPISKAMSKAMSKASSRTSSIYTYII